MSGTLLATTPLQPSINVSDPFAFHMHAMRMHYKDGAAQMYSLPLALLKTSLRTVRNGGTANGMTTARALVAQAGGFTGLARRNGGLLGGVIVGPIETEGNRRLDEVLQASKAGMLAWNDSQKAGVNAATAQLQATGNTGSFADQMNAQRNQAKQQVDAQIDHYYDQAISVGMQYPETQTRILQTSNGFGAFVNTVIESIGSFFTNIVNKIIQWVAQAVQWVEQAAKDVADWFSNAASDIGDFFSSLF